MNRALLSTGALVVCCAPMTGCSVFMAATGGKTPNLTVLQEGVHRGVIELELGPPIQISINDSGETTAVYEYWTGDDPDMGRAVLHGAMDILTFGLWEVIGTPVEAIASGEQHSVTVSYDPSQRVVAVNNPVFVRREDDKVTITKPYVQTDATPLDD